MEKKKQVKTKAMIIIPTMIMSRRFLKLSILVSVDSTCLAPVKEIVSSENVLGNPVFFYLIVVCHQRSKSNLFISDF